MLHGGAGQALPPHHELVTPHVAATLCILQLRVVPAKLDAPVSGSESVGSPTWVLLCHCKKRRTSPLKVHSPVSATHLCTPAPTSTSNIVLTPNQTIERLQVFPRTPPPLWVGIVTATHQNTQPQASLAPRCEAAELLQADSRALP